MAQSEQNSRTFELIIARAVIDSAFRARFLEDKESVIREYQLTESDINSIMKVDRAVLDAAREVGGMIGVVHLNSGE